MIQSFFLMYQHAFYDNFFLVYLSFQATTVIARSFVSAKHMRIARGVWMVMILPCLSLTLASNVLYYNAQLYLWYEYYFSATVFMSILFAEESILRFTAMRQTMNRVTVRSRSPPLRKKKKKSTQTPHVKIRPCKTSPPNNSVYGSNYETEVSLREGAGGVMSARLHNRHVHADQ